MPHTLRNTGNYIISLGDLCRWLGEQAEALGCSVLPGFAAADVLYDSGRVVGVVTGDMGVARNGTMKPNYQGGYELKSRFTVFAEGLSRPSRAATRSAVRFTRRRRSAAPCDRVQGDLADRS